LIAHCNNKENLVKTWNLDFIDADFKIGLKDYEYFRPEIPYVITSDKILNPLNALEIDFPTSEPSIQSIEDYKASYENNTFVNNGLRKIPNFFRRLMVKTILKT
jgi:hypothetical protein